MPECKIMDDLDVVDGRSNDLTWSELKIFATELLAACQVEQSPECGTILHSTFVGNIAQPFLTMIGQWKQSALDDPIELAKMYNRGMEAGYDSFVAPFLIECYEESLTADHKAAVMVATLAAVVGDLMNMMMSNDLKPIISIRGKILSKKNRDTIRQTLMDGTKLKDIEDAKPDVINVILKHFTGIWMAEDNQIISFIECGQRIPHEDEAGYFALIQRNIIIRTYDSIWAQRV